MLLLAERTCWHRVRAVATRETRRAKKCNEREKRKLQKRVGDSIQQQFASQIFEGKLRWYFLSLSSCTFFLSGKQSLCEYVTTLSLDPRDILRRHTRVSVFPRIC